MFQRLLRRTLSLTLRSAVVSAMAIAAMLSVSQAAAAPNWTAILVGAEKYDLPALRLSCINNDVRQMTNTLQQRAGYEAKRIHVFVDNSQSENRRPRRATLLSELPKLLSQLTAADHALIYFSGHGVKDDAGELYLAPLDVDPSDIAGTGISVAWLRKVLNDCPAAMKVLVIDACHAGSEKSAEESYGVTAKELAAPFAGLEGVYTLASSTGDQKSQIWHAKEQSLFTYYLTRGLSGAADRDANGEITFEETYDYVFRNVSQAAEARFPLKQTPVQSVRRGRGVPVLARSNPQPLRTAINDLAEQLVTEMQLRKLEKVGVLDFAYEDFLRDEQDLAGNRYGILGRSCAADLEQQLISLGTGSFELIDRARLKRAVKQLNFSIDDQYDGDKLQRLATEVGGMPVALTGVIKQPRHEHWLPLEMQKRVGLVVLQCQLTDTEKNTVLARARALAVLNEDEWSAWWGRSFQVTSADHNRADRVSRFDGVRPIDALLTTVGQPSAPHPMDEVNNLEPSPFRVQIMVAGKERRGKFVGNNYYVPLSKNEIYTIRLQVPAGGPHLLRLLVDGLNTLPQPLKDAKGVEIMEIAPAVPLAKARHWVLEAKQDQPKTEYEVPGFVTETGARGKHLTFKVVDTLDSVAARKNFSDNIGVITAAFYAPDPKGGRGVGTGFGAEGAANFHEVTGPALGKLRCVIHVRYCEPSAMP